MGWRQGWMSQGWAVNLCGKVRAPNFLGLPRTYVTRNVKIQGCRLARFPPFAKYAKDGAPPVCWRRQVASVPSSDGERTPLDDRSCFSVPSLRDSVPTFHAYPALTCGAITCRPFGTWFLSPLLLTPGTCGAITCRPFGTGFLSPLLLTPDLRPGLMYAVPTGLGLGGCPAGGSTSHATSRSKGAGWRGSHLSQNTRKMGHPLFPGVDELHRSLRRRTHASG